MQNKETKKTALVRKQQGPLLYIVISVIIVAVLVAGFLLLKNNIQHVDYKQVKIGNTSYSLEVANTEAARTQGLSERDGLATNSGMLFDFKQNGNWLIWMHGMRFNIDVAWLTQEGKIITIKQNAVPGDYPDTYHATQPSWYVIEAPAGTFAKQNVTEGDTLAL